MRENKKTLTMTVSGKADNIYELDKIYKSAYYTSNIFTKHIKRNHTLFKMFEDVEVKIKPIVRLTDPIFVDSAVESFHSKEVDNFASKTQSLVHEIVLYYFSPN